MSQHETSGRFAAIYDDTGDGAFLRVFGEVDIATSPAFEEAVQRATMHGKPLTIDLCECAYIDSSGLAIIARAAKRYGISLDAIVKPRTSVARVMEVTSFGRILPIHFAEDAKPANSKNVAS